MVFISNEAASSQRESVNLVLNNKQGLKLCKNKCAYGQRLGTQLIEISCVRVVGL